MKIITIPHPTLRKVSAPISQLDEKTIKFINELEQTLTDTQKPKGVGLAAPQVDTLWRAFTTHLSGEVLHFINPVIIKACKRKMILGTDSKNPDLEGCLSMPGLYGPVPRHRWVEIEYQTIVNDKLTNHKKRFDDFHARVIQHELDHLDGILFTDYALQNGLPVYHQSNESKQMVEVDKQLLEII